MIPVTVSYPFLSYATSVAYEDLKLLLLSFIMQFSMFFSRLNQPNTYSLWWAQVDSNHRPRAYQARALTG